MKKIEGLARFKKYDVKVMFRELKTKNKTPDYQMLIFLDDELAYATSRKSFTIAERDIGRKLTLKDLMFWKNIERTPNMELYLKWDERAHNKYYQWCKGLRMCGKIQEIAFAEKVKFQKNVLNNNLGTCCNNTK